MLEVSIITPIKATKPHHLTWLNEAIHSVAAQSSIQSCEMIIVDDNSTIDLGPVKSLWDRLTWIESTEHGVSNARNIAAQHARASLLLPLDADDKLSPEAVESFLKSWYNHRDNIIYSDVIMFTQDTQRAWIAPEYSFHELLDHTTILVGSLHKKADWQRVGGWRPDMNQGLEDWEYWIALGEIGVCGHHVNEFLYWYRMNPGGRLTGLKKDGQKEFQTAKLRLRDLHQDTYNGRFPMNCCGGRSTPGTPSSRPSTKAQLAAILQDGERTPIQYVGKRAGSFQLTGPTGVTYNVTGANAIVTDNNGKPGVLKQDVAFVMNFRGQFAVVRPQKPKVVQAPVINQKRSVPIDPEMVVDKHASELNFEASVPDPSTLTVKQIQALDLTESIAYVMLSMEQAGKKRKGVISHLRNLTNAQ